MFEDHEGNVHSHINTVYRTIKKKYYQVLIVVTPSTYCRQGFCSQMQWERGLVVFKIKFQLLCWLENITMSHNSALVMNACLQENLSWALTILTVLTLKPCQADAIYYFYYLSVIVPSTAILMINIIISIYYIMVLPSNMTIENRIIPRTLNLNFMIWSLSRWLSTRHEWVSEAMKALLQQFFNCSGLKETSFDWK